MQKFKMSPKFLEEYKEKEVNWGFNGLGYFVFKRTYARPIYDKNDKIIRTEEWWETVQRVVEGSFSYQKQHCNTLGLPWNNNKAQQSAQIMYDKIFTFRFTPAGRGLWLTGTEFVESKGSFAVNNCSFISTENIDITNTNVFEWTMDGLMLGIGVGFDTLGAGKFEIKQPAAVNPWTKKKPIFVIPDSREGWVEALRWKLKAYFNGSAMPEYDFSKIRKEGMPIKGFGGTASGPKPLQELLNNIDDLLEPEIGNKISETIIVDLMNFIARCVVAGGVRRCLPEYYEILTENGWEKIQDILVGDMVIINNESYPITGKINNGYLEKIKITTPSGYHECSKDHKWKVYNKNTEKIEWIKTINLIPDIHFLLQDKL